MTKPLFMAKQASHPRGLVGHVLGRLMAFDTAYVNRWVLEAVDPMPGERVLEVGCGHGRALAAVAKRVENGLAFGVDPSQVMCELAGRYNRRAIRGGQVRVERGDSENIPANRDRFDRAFSVHTLYFWPDVEAGLAELHRVVKPGGALFLAFHSRDNADVSARLPSSVYSLMSDEDVAVALERCGFEKVEISIEPKTQVRLARATA